MTVASTPVEWCAPEPVSIRRLCTGWTAACKRMRRFEAGEPALELVRVLEAPGVAHLRYRVLR